MLLERGLALLFIRKTARAQGVSELKVGRVRFKLDFSFAAFANSVASSVLKASGDSAVNDVFAFA